MVTLSPADCRKTWISTSQLTLSYIDNVKLKWLRVITKIPCNLVKNIWHALLCCIVSITSQSIKGSGIISVSNDEIIIVVMI